jgi:hypothetical protein
MKLVMKSKCFAAKKYAATKKSAVSLKSLTMDRNAAAAGTDVVKMTAETKRKALKYRL